MFITYLLFITDLGFYVLCTFQYLFCFLSIVYGPICHFMSEDLETTRAIIWSQLGNIKEETKDEQKVVGIYLSEISILRKLEKNSCRITTA